MSTILESDESGTLHLPSSLLPKPGPHRKYRVASVNDQVVVTEAASTAKPWMELAGCMKHESAELDRIKQVIADEFEQVDAADWQ